jgi:hypothetical protein
MTEYWTNLSGNSKFSIIAFFIAFVFGFISLGLQGAMIYFPASLFLRKYGSLNSWRGDWVWPACITAGMFWSFGFLIAGYSFSLCRKLMSSAFILYLIYAAVLWLWATLIWYVILKNNK